MGRVDVLASQSVTRFARFVLAAIAMFAFFVEAQGRTPGTSATVQGSVRDALGHPIASATVSLQVKNGTQALTAHTDSQGNYSFSALDDGSYILRVQVPGYALENFGPFLLGQKEQKRIDLALKPTKHLQTSSTETPQFFDEPQFTVAGVTDPANAGGHGSDRVLRSTEAMARETVSLKREPPAESRSVSGQVAEKSLHEAIQREPGNFDANCRLGKLLFDEGKPKEALPYLERASRLDPDDYQSAYQLALAYADTGAYENARTKATKLLGRQGLPQRDQAA
jgi:tetratricopeptide (TPR) repeat protein